MRDASEPGACLGPADPPAFSTHTGGSRPVLITCDHASPRVPVALGDLGLPPARFAEHIAYDLGARELCTALAERIGARAVVCEYSRLVVDCNRFPGHAASIPELSDGVEIPGNHGLTPAARAGRYREIFEVYHAQVSRSLDALQDRAPPGAPLLLALHTFTPRMDGFDRPWHVGVLSGEDRRVADPLLAALRADPELCVGDNQPYSAVEPLGYSTVVHCERRGLHHALLEIRQDLLATAAGVDAWCTILESALGRARVLPGA